LQAENYQAIIHYNFNEPERK